MCPMGNYERKPEYGRLGTCEQGEVFCIDLGSRFISLLSSENTSGVLED